MCYQGREKKKPSQLQCDIPLSFFKGHYFLSENEKWKNVHLRINKIRYFTHSFIHSINIFLLPTIGSTPYRQYRQAIPTRHLHSSLYSAVHIPFTAFPSPTKRIGKIFKGINECIILSSLIRQHFSYFVHSRHSKYLVSEIINEKECTQCNEDSSKFR